MFTINTAAKSKGTKLINDATPTGKLDKFRDPKTLTKTSKAITPIIASIADCKKFKDPKTLTKTSKAITPIIESIADCNIAMISPPKQTKKTKKFKNKTKTKH